MALSTSPANLFSTFLTTYIDKIINAFLDLDADDLDGLIQFWAPVQTVGGMWLLTTSDQPFVLTKGDKDIMKYRSCSVKYQYNIDPNNLHVEGMPSRIISGAPATAFLNQMPELLPYMRAHPTMTPLVSSALRSGLFRSLVIPVFYPSESCCVGVVEFCSSSYGELVRMFNDLKTAFEVWILSYFRSIPLMRVLKCFSHKNVYHSTLKNAKNEIDVALEMIWQTFRLDLVQVWIAYKDKQQVAFSSLENNQRKRMLGLKLTERYEVRLPYGCEFKHFAGYTKLCNMLPLKKGEGIIGKALQNYEPHLFKKVPKLSDSEPQMLLSCFNSEGVPFECSCFVICLRSSKTSDLDFVFEFLWHEGPNYVMLLESLLLLLKRCLPHFKYASGAELGDELRVIDAKNSTERETGSFKIFQGKKSSSAYEALEKKGPMVKEVAKNLDASVFVKNLHKNQSDMNEEEEDKGGAIQDPLPIMGKMCLDENVVTIKAEYAGDVIKFNLPIASTTFDIIQKIVKKFKLDPAACYKLKYLDHEDNEWILLTCDEDMKVSLQNGRNSSRVVRLRLLE
ncbi:hypothetical protein OSB04_010432 [Centaurea solstitialis]|uniref:PB1 domain-containing protein n=1 Tax=Centaurea solstitialis TaxID=347529 RepID=A0AA38TSD4_9ASTR|nr:hypothetical protein OSB04_010432 [Centaurea solstitialis]